MARTKRIQPVRGAPPTPSSPEFVPDDSPPPGAAPPGTPTPSSSSNKRRARADTNPPTPPIKKRTRKAATPGPVIAEPEQTLNNDNTVTSVVGSADGSGEEEDDMETPKASKTSKGKGKAANLKTQLGGTIGVDTVRTPPAPTNSNRPILIELPSTAFTLENKSQWADSVTEGNKVQLYVIARSSDDPLLATKSILDPYMVQHGLYDNLPKANNLQLTGFYEMRHWGGFTDGSLSSEVPGLSMKLWDAYDLNLEYLASIHRFKRQGLFVNPSTVDVTDLMFREEYSRQGPSMAFIACDRLDPKPVIFVMAGAAMSSFLVHGKNVGFEGRAPFAKGFMFLGHRFEYERFSCVFATLWHGSAITAPISDRQITFQTGNRRNADANTSTPESPAPKKVGKMEIPTYSVPGTPSRQGSGSKNSQPYIEFNSQVPLYDGRFEDFDPEDIAGSLAHLPPFLGENGELPEGCGIVVGYTAATSKFMSAWKLTFYVQWVVVIAL